MYILINGYGVPKNIDTDHNYNSYLGQVLNYLWDRYRGDTLTLILAGGNTDMYPPYRKTEAGEMVRWLKPRLAALGLARQWKVRTISTTLSVVENLLAARRIVGRGRVLYCCEKLNARKARRLAREVFGARVRVLPIDFNTSPPRYDRATRRAMDREDLRYSLRALHDAKWRRRLNDANREKIRVLRRTPPTRRRVEIERITLRVRREFMGSS